MAICPFAVNKLIPAGSNDPHLDEVYGAVLHVAVTTQDSLYDYFAHQSGGIESHFYVRLDGTIEQYRDTSWEADAQLEGNSFGIAGGKRGGFASIETAGMGPGTWNDDQLASIKRLLKWLSATHDFPLTKCAGPFSKGVGYHTMWGAPSQWTPVAKSCPGPERVKQFEDTLLPWMAHVTSWRNAPKPAPTRVTEARADLEALVKKVATAKRVDDKPERDKALDAALDLLRQALKTLPER